MALPDGLRIAAVGDVFLDRDEPEHAFRHVQGVFRDFDIVFGNLEGVYARDWHRAPSAGVSLVADPKVVPHLAQAGLNVLSLANNHSVDGGFDALLHTREAIRGVGIATAGAGANIADAREPAVVDTPHGRVAVLAYASVFPHGYEARPGWPGLAPMRAYTHYEPWETNEWNPGLQPRVLTVAHEGDQRALHDDITAAKQQADLVLASFHWGDFTRPYVLTDHERRTARVAIDADAVLGHHHHLLRGVEHYRNKPIFCGLGHFVFDLPDFENRLARDAYLGRGNAAEIRASARRFGDYRIAPREGYPILPFHPDARMTGIATLTVANDRLHTGMVPCTLGPENQPRPAPSQDAADTVRRYLHPAATKSNSPPWCALSPDLASTRGCCGSTTTQPPDAAIPSTRAHGPSPATWRYFDETRDQRKALAGSPYSPVVIAGGLRFLAGHLGIDANQQLLDGVEELLVGKPSTTSPQPCPPQGSIAPTSYAPQSG